VSAEPRLEAFRLIGGPCDGQIAELPVEGYEEVWRCLDEDEPTYARYERDGAVFRFAGDVETAEQMGRRLSAIKAAGRGVSATLRRDSRDYER
jgi:hypothetical protein